MDRKKFLKNLGFGLVATPIITSISCSSKDDIIKSTTAACGVTKSDMLGPYYVSGSSQITNLNTQNFSGDKIIVSGKLYGGEDKSKPIANAMIEVWHADSDGIYHPVGDGNVSDYKADKITLRGFVNTNAEGDYIFESIRPGVYPGRPRHFHYKITANGYKTLVTQIYFKGDPTTADEDIDSCRIIDFKKDTNGIYKGIAVIHLASN
ncbi:hypothetical protein PG913_12525 [Tenacibaculum pacificus]|uniref:dioxygenase family protein n=1 Tax=Tenacibaculum pacificus TaxID=3018314 RepID=UPI0022F3C6C6|nr:hypothetical protein [Tenacibaculum pacificus]WBX73636.1 hypothetical protein PG913_12525 [Tenacibaculum pacificus]